MSDERPAEVVLIDAERRIEEAKASLEERLEHLKRDAERVKQTVEHVEHVVDPRWRIAAHPLVAVFGALAAGFGLGLLGSMRRSRG